MGHDRGTRRRRIRRAPTAWVGLALLAALTLSRPVTGQDALEDLLGQSWRWRAIPADKSPTLLREVRPSRDGGVISSQERAVLAYDGWSWTIIPALDVPGFAHVTAAYPRGDEWIIFHEAGVVVLTDHATPPSGRADARVLAGARDGRPPSISVEMPDGRILSWVDGDIVEFTTLGGRPVLRGPETEAPIRALYRSTAGRLRAVTEGALWEHDGERWQHLDEGRLWPPGTSIARVVIGGRNRVFLLPATIDEARPGWFWDDDQLMRLPPLDDGRARYVHDAVASVDGELVIATRPGWLSVFRDGAWRHVDAVPPMGSGEFVRSICFTSEQRFVLLTASSRLYAADLSTGRWQPHGPDQGYKDVSNVSAIEPDGEGGLWVGLHEGLAHWDGHTFDRYFNQAGDDGPMLQALTGVAVDARGHIWMGSGNSQTFHGAVEFDGETWTHHTAPAQIGSFPIHAIRNLDDGGLWFTLLSPGGDLHESGGIVRLDDKGWRRFTEADGLPHGRCYDVARTPDGVLWAATLLGLARLEGERWKPITDPMAPQGRVFALFAASDGTLWAGRGLMDVGVSAWRNGTWKHLRPMDGLPAAAAAFTEDAEGRIFFASDTGLYRVHEDVFEDLTRLTEAPYSTFWPLRSDGAGGLWLGSRGDGLVHYAPDDRRAPKILAPRLTPHSEDTSVIVRWNASDYWAETPAEKLRYAIKVDGDEWSAITDFGQHTLRGMQPGHHSVSLSATDAVGNTGVMPAPLETTVPDPFARQNALKLSGLFVVMALAVLAATWLLRQRERRREMQRLEAVTSEFVATHEEERQFISEELHDEVGQLLTAVSLDLQLAERLDDAPRRGEALRRALTSSREALERTRELSSRLRPRLLDELGLDQALRESLSEFERRTGAVVETDIELADEGLPERLRGQLYRIVQESLQRIARADAPSRVTLRVRQRDPFIEMHLEDDGPAWSAEDGRYAAEIVRQRVRMLEGRLTFEGGQVGQNRLFLSVPNGIER